MLGRDNFEGHRTAGVRDLCGEDELEQPAGMSQRRGENSSSARREKTGGNSLNESQKALSAKCTLKKVAWLGKIPQRESALRGMVELRGAGGRSWGRRKICRGP